MKLSGIEPYSPGRTYQSRENPDNKPASEPSSLMRISAEGQSPRGMIPAASAVSQGEAGKSNPGGSQNGRRSFDSYDCETCKNRTYQDGSDDPGVSFKTPTKLSPDKAASAVRAHENEHVNREQASAVREDRKVVSQSVTYHSAICPECGTSYVSGGTTRTVTKGQVEKTYGLVSEEKGKNLDLAV